jgi:WD40 repeat protein
MTDERRARLWALFDQAADLPPGEQRALLDAACPDDPALRAEVEKLLADDAQLRAEGAAAFLRSPLLRPTKEADLPAERPTRLAEPALPARIGPYRIVRRLGEGGMGAVYEAEQDNPRRCVALKVIRPGLLSPALLKRFAHEAQILGRLHHPGVAQIYEAGVAEDGQPFFALELIRGEALDEYARRQALAPAARLDLLARVCDAVQHAHEQGVIHRDLKPGNILVDESGQPKVLDFGVARALDADVVTSTGHTRTGQLVGTLAYMSPEQVAADPAGLDRRSDVYTLGVILFELLAGRLPYPLEHLPLPEAARLIQQHEPSRLGSIDTRLRGAVETIVAKALEKDRARRYQSAAELAADIRRHLRHEPIRARPPSALYQLGKFARRHKGLVGAVLAVMAALAAGTVVSVLYAVQAAHNARVAGENARQASENERRAQYQTYRARLAAAGAALQLRDVADAARQLADAPEGLRDWEWQHLRSRLDDSSAAFSAPARATHLLPAGVERAGLRWAVVADQAVRVLDEQGNTQRTVPFPKGSRGLLPVTSECVLFQDPVADGVARVRDETGQVWLSLAAPAGSEIYMVAVSPNRKRLAVNWHNPAGFTGVYDSSGKELARLPNLHTAQLWALTFSPDGTRLASGSDDGTARLWDAATGQPIGGPLYHPGRLKVLSAAFRPDGARFLTTSADGTVCQWDARTGAAVEPPYERHTGEVWTASYSPDGQWVASGGTDRTVRLWRATGRQDALVRNGHTGAVTELAFSGDGRRLGSMSEDGTVRIWEADPQDGLPVLRGHTRYVYPVAYSPDGRWLASGGWDGRVLLWDARTGEREAELPLGGNVRALAFSPDSTWLVTGCDNDARLQIWDVATARLRKALRGPGDTLAAVAVSPDGARIAALAYNGKLSVSEVGTGEEVFHTAMGLALKATVAYSPDGRWLAGASEDGNSVRLWHAQTFQLAAQFSGHKGAIHAVAFSPDGRHLASGGADHVVRVWETGTGVCRAELHGHTDRVFAAAFHPGGTRLATAGRDQAVWLWDLARGEAVARLPGHANYVWSLAFSPDGKTLASGSGDKTVRLWDTAPLKTRYEARREAAAPRPGLGLDQRPGIPRQIGAFTDQLLLDRTRLLIEPICFTRPLASAMQVGQGKVRSQKAAPEVRHRRVIAHQLFPDRLSFAVAAQGLQGLSLVLVDSRQTRMHLRQDDARLCDRGVVNKKSQTDVPGLLQAPECFRVLPSHAVQVAELEIGLGEVTLKVHNAAVVADEGFERGAGLFPAAESLVRPPEGVVHGAALEIRASQVILPPDVVGVVLEESLPKVPRFLQ